MRLPSSIFVSVSLFTAETTAALYLSSTYRSAGDQIWQGLTLLFTLVPSVLVQLTLTFIHRDLGRDRPLVLLLHILQLGPIVSSIRCCAQQSLEVVEPGRHPLLGAVSLNLSLLSPLPPSHLIDDPPGLPILPFTLRCLYSSHTLHQFLPFDGIVGTEEKLFGFVQYPRLSKVWFTLKVEACFLHPTPCRYDLRMSGPCLEAFCIYGSVGRVEEPYVSITRKKQIPRGGQSEEVERQVGQAEGKLFTHRAAFARSSVIQAFLGSALSSPCSSTSPPCSRGCPLGEVRKRTLMVISLLSIVYGALRCNILAIKIKYDDYEVDVRPVAYMCIFLWRSFEIASRVVVLVLFSSVLQLWILPVVLLNFIVFFFYPWILFWLSHSPFPENIEKTLTRVGTTIVLCLLTFLYAGINMFCWSAVQVKLCDPDLINKSQNWYRMAVYYMLRFLENASLLLLWFMYKTEVYNFICAPLLVLLLLLAYGIAIFFMLQYPGPLDLLLSPLSLMQLCFTTEQAHRKVTMSPTRKEPANDGAQDTSSDTTDDMPNETTYDMLNDTVCDSPNKVSNNICVEINGDINHSVSCNA
ncbi:hypothetical protein F7725_001961 [Dissostichus mawsoni]|uniref:XK-related protein n=1 Tax=Dissostichus mawsoni TaxID=36200 RepID=A0A7J5Y119_DISMA|nr:hypothetical protein F7725_001961 [Dissostichus mawsoni]